MRLDAHLAEADIEDGDVDTGGAIARELRQERAVVRSHRHAAVVVPHEGVAEDRLRVEFHGVSARRASASVAR